MTDETPSRPNLDVAFHINVLLPAVEPETLPAALDAIAAAGYSRVVLPPMDPAATDAATLGRIFAERGIAPIAMGGGQGGAADVSSSDGDARAAGAAALRAAVDLAVGLGSDQLNGVPYGPFGPSQTATTREAVERSALEVGRVADYARERGIAMTFEVLNRYETSMINTAAQAMEYVGLSGSENLGIHLDTFHMAIEEADMSEAIRLALPKLRYLELGQSGRGHLSTGAVDIAAVVGRALDDGYEGRWGVEAFTRPLLSPQGADILAIWRDVYDDGSALAVDAMRVIQRGWSMSTVGRRAQRLARGATV